MSLRSVRDAVVSSLEVDLPGAVFTSYGATNVNRYAVVFPALAEKSRTRLMSGQTRDIFTVTVHSVGTSEESALWVAERVDDLTGRVLEVASRRVQPVEFVTGREPVLDDSGVKPLWYVVSQFDIYSDPA
jgi:hypothetical protein